MFEIARRGFLQTTAMAAVGMLASFDTAKKLWIPESHLTIGDDVLELNDLALQFAKKMAERMGDERAQRVVLSPVLFEAGSRELDGTIRMEKGGRSIRFVPHPHRIVKTGDASDPRRLLDFAASETMQSVRRQHITAFAPINAKMRHGGDFTDATIGVATDPVSGLSARSLRFKNIEGETLTSLELAVGEWRDVRLEAIEAMELRRRLLDEYGEDTWEDD